MISNYIIDFSDNATEDEISQYIVTHDCTIVKTFLSFSKVLLVSALEIPPKTNIVEEVVVDNAHPFKLHEIFSPTGIPPTGNKTLVTNDINNWWKVYSLKDVTFENATIDVPIYGKGVDVYLIDSGINKDHPEFANANVVLLHSVNGDFIDTSGHGTALGSLIVGETCGITSATLKVVKLFDASTTTLQSDFLAALDAILVDYVTSGSAFSVVNMSWAISKNAFIERKIQSLINIGMAVVVAAGNSGVPIEEVTPASMVDVYTIGSFNQDFKPSSFSNYTNPTITSLTASDSNYGSIDCWAPGEEIWAANVNGGYGFVAGTSAAAAICSAALAYNVNKTWISPTTNTLYSILKDSTGKLEWEGLTLSTRKNLLNLSDIKYLSSKNEIITFTNTIKKETHLYVVPKKIVARVGEKVGQLFLSPQLVKTYEFLNPLPPGVFMEDYFLYFSPTIEPSEASGVNVQEIGYRVTNTDNEVQESILTFVTLATSFDVSILPVDDPLINVTIMFISCQDGDYPCGTPCSAYGAGCATHIKSVTTCFSCG